jgi:hypothetical protein
MPKVHHREVFVDLTDKDTNDRFLVCGLVTHAMKRAAVPDEEIDLFREEVFRLNGKKEKASKDLMKLIKSWVTVETGEHETTNRDH